MGYSPTWAQVPCLFRFLGHIQTHIHPVAFLWTSDRPLAEVTTSTQDTTHKTNISALTEIRNLSPNNRTAVDQLPRRHGHRCRSKSNFESLIIIDKYIKFFSWAQLINYCSVHFNINTKSNQLIIACKINNNNIILGKT